MVQDVVVDGAEQGRHDPAVLGEAIRRELTAAGVTPAELARRLHVADSTVSRLIGGLVQDVSLDRVLQIEAVLGLPRGRLLRVGGVVSPDDGATTRERIENDPLLTGEELRIVLRIYDASVDASNAGRNKSSDNKAPAERRTRRS